MFDNDKIKTYYYTKFLQSYLYNDNIYEAVFNSNFDNYIFDEDFLNIAFNYIEVYTEINYADLSVKEKLYNLISYIRNKADYDDEKTQKFYYDIYNTLILKLNRMDNNSLVEFLILNEIAMRTKIKFDNEISYHRFKQYEEFVRRSIGYDFILLTYLSDETSEETFDNNIESLVNDEFYFASLNALIEQCPELLKEITFRKRVKKVLEYNRKNIDLWSSKSIKKKIFIIKQNNKHYKKFKTVE